MQNVNVMTDERISAQEKAHKYAIDLEGKVFKHFKGNFYKVLGVGVHSETAEVQVIYRSYNEEDLGSDPKVWIRPLDMFLSKVDKEKYPDVEQEYRFTQVDHRLLSRT